ncbi:MAG TPA: hypothetical protein DEA97_10320 [Bacteroidales bacterium]|nr:hypothetical protein [Bacteroidales bacterium]
MKNNNKIPSFTLVEITVTMLITATVVSMAMWIYININRYYSKKTEENIYLNDVLEFQQLLKNDMEKSQEVSYTENELVCVSAVKQNKYLFSQKYILRETDLRTDTFYLEVKNIEVQKINEGPVCRVSMMLSSENKNINLTVVKEYPRDVRFENAVKQLNLQSHWQ